MKALAPLLALALLAACGDARADRERAMAEGAAASDKVACAMAGAARFERVCTVERSRAAEGLILTIRAPGGSFRRLLVTRDGRGVVAADGADPALVTLLSADSIEVAVAGDRFRLPARVKGR